jgi:hypothetical protein
MMAAGIGRERCIIGQLIAPRKHSGRVEMMDSHKGSSNGSSISEIVLTISAIIMRMSILTTPSRVIFRLSEAYSKAQ